MLFVLIGALIGVGLWVTNPGWDNFIKTLAIVLGWPIIVLLVGLLYRQPLSQLIESVASNAGRAKIKIGEGFEWSVSQLDEAIIEREILKMCIYIATADKKYDEREFQFLEGRAEAMVGNLKSLTKEAKKRVIVEVVNMATVDGEVQSQEYIAILQKAQEFGISDTELDAMVIDRCILKKAEPPPQLAPGFQQKKDRLERLKLVE
jgi:uncharacterized tellurite resistance protein B-like protein